MSVVVTSAAATRALTTAARITTATGLGTVPDTLILAASALVVSRLGYELAKETVTETLQGTDRYRLIVSRVPVISISAATAYGTSIATEITIEDKGLGFLTRDASWPSASYFARGASDFPHPDMGELPYSITYVAGYWLPSFSGSAGGTDVLLPDWAEMAAIDIAKVLHLQRGSASLIASENVGGEYAVTYARAALADARGIAGLSPVAEALLAPHARVSL